MTDDDMMNQSYNLPPSGSDADSDEDAAGEYTSPENQASDAEAAAMTQSQELLSGVDATLLEIKNGIESHLRQAAASAAGAQSFELGQGAGNILGVGIGLGDPASLAGGAPGTHSIVVYVNEPSSAEEVKQTVVESMGVNAAASDDVPITVERTGPIDALAHRFRLRPAPGGISVGHFRITAGTFGCLSIGRSAPRNQRLMILSNNHVLANSNSAVFGDCIAQPGPYDGGKCPQDQVAILERFVPINFGGGINYVDCATGWAWPDRVRRELVYLSGGSLYYFRINSVPAAPGVGAIVGKSGRTTQLTQGRITAVGVSVNVNYGGGRVAHFADQIAVQSTTAGANFSAGGDSGSVIWTWNQYRNPVGLLFAGGGNTTFANRMTRVLPALDINLVT